LCCFACTPKVTCHHLSAMAHKDCRLRVGLSDPHPASLRLAAFVRDFFQLAAGIIIRSSNVSRHSVFGVSHVNDVVFFIENGSIQAGQVWAHVDKGSDAAPDAHTLLQAFELVNMDRKAGTAMWRVPEKYDFIPTGSIVDVAVWNAYDAGVVRTILPRDL
jgi:hypothetical protein